MLSGIYAVTRPLTTQGFNLQNGLAFSNDLGINEPASAEVYGFRMNAVNLVDDYVVNVQWVSDEGFGANIIVDARYSQSYAVVGPPPGIRTDLTGPITPLVPAERVFGPYLWRAATNWRPIIHTFVRPLVMSHGPNSILAFTITPTIPLDPGGRTWSLGITFGGDLQ